MFEFYYYSSIKIYFCCWITCFFACITFMGRCFRSSEMSALFFVRIRGPPLINSKNIGLIGGKKMNNRPKRRKFRDNPYELIINNNIYIIKFIDSNKHLQTIEVSPEIFKVFDDSELRDLSEMNEYDNHIEHSEICENTMYKRKVDEEETLEDQIIRKSSYEDLMKAINTLPEIQKRRIKKYYFEDKTLCEIAKEENTTHQAISKSLSNAVEKLKKYLKI